MSGGEWLVDLDASPQAFVPKALARIAPVHHAQINMRGIFTFSLGRFRHRLFETPVAGGVPGGTKPGEREKSDSSGKSMKYIYTA